MNIQTLEKSKKELFETVFKDYQDKLDVTLGLKCLVVCIVESSWEGPLPSHFNNIPITYLFGCRPTRFAL